MGTPKNTPGLPVPLTIHWNDYVIIFFIVTSTIAVVDDGGNNEQHDEQEDKDRYCSNKRFRSFANV